MWGSALTVRQWMGLFLSVASVVFVGDSLRAADFGPSALDTQLAPVVDALVRQLTEQNPNGRQYSIAAMPLAEAGTKRQRRVGVVVADTVTRILLAKRISWASVQERVAVGDLLEEHNVWAVDAMARGQGADGTPAPFLAPADMLVVGSTAVAAQTVKLELRIVTSRTGRAVAAAACALELPFAERGRLLAFVNRPGSGEPVADVAAVSAISLKLTAQRPNPFGGLEKRWAVAPKEALRAGDRFNVRLSVDADACVYLLLWDSVKKDVSLLFPLDDWREQFKREFGRPCPARDNYCRAEWEYRAPGLDADGKPLFYRLDDSKCRNVLYVLAHRSELRNVRDIMQRLEQAGSDAERLQLLTDDVGVDAVETFELRQE